MKRQKFYLKALFCFVFLLFLKSYIETRGVHKVSTELPRAEGVIVAIKQEELRHRVTLVKKLVMYSVVLASSFINYTCYTHYASELDFEGHLTCLSAIVGALTLWAYHVSEAANYIKAYISALGAVLPTAIGSL